MELIQTIALLCQISVASDAGYNYSPIDTFKYQTACQQSYLNCVLKRSEISKVDALQKCILEK